MMDPSVVQEHHVKSEYCYTRPRYREGRLEKAVKVAMLAGAANPFVCISDLVCAANSSWLHQSCKISENVPSKEYLSYQKWPRFR